MSNIDNKTVEGFGDEWSRFDQQDLSLEARKKIFDDYFAIFPWDKLPKNAVGADIGCGSGRWGIEVASRIGFLTLVDASPAALDVAKRNLAHANNVKFILGSVGDLPIQDASLDFAYSLGVLHHVPDTAGAIKAVSKKLKSGAPFLIYLYYAFDNRGPLFKLLWRTSDIVRRVVSKSPHGLRYFFSQLIAFGVYYPLARGAAILKKFHMCPNSWPLQYYSDKPLYVLRTDALDRFGTRLEQRFSKIEIKQMLIDADMENITFSDSAPYWCAIAYKR